MLLSLYQSICLTLCISIVTGPKLAKATDDTNTKPNLLVIMTDQHNLKTLGCYRNLVENHKKTWGPQFKKRTKELTRNLDKLAEEGAIFQNFNAVYPSCTPSRGSFMTGLYPEFTGAYHNHIPLKPESEIQTFAKVLKDNGYSTSYMGKWHLNGNDRPGFGEYGGDRHYGFSDIKYQFNQGHWKFLEEEPDGNLLAYVYDEGVEKFTTRRQQKEHFTTDFLFDRGIEYMRRKINKNEPFALMLSIPDPHT